jgi:hypothetical protein
VLIHSGGSRYWGTETYWNGWCYPDEEAAQALIARNISAIGLDGPSADPVETTTFPLHKTWLSAGRMILENLTNLDQLPERTLLVVAPMKVRGATRETENEQERKSIMAHIYQIIVQGHLDTDWSEELEGLTITHRSDGTSLLAGPLLDESALHGLLLKVCDLGLQLLSLSRIEAQDPQRLT